MKSTDEIYNKFKNQPTHYDEEFHCKLLIEVMHDKSKGTVCAFCVDATISERTFWKWTNKYELFGEIYCYGIMVAKKLWENEGRALKDMFVPLGTISHAFEYWRLIGWSRFGISKNSRIRLNLDPKDTPDKHYAQLMKQANEGHFTAGELKQLMEAVNVGLNTHQVYELQRQIDQLTSDLSIMNENKNGNYTGTNQTITQKD